MKNANRKFYVASNTMIDDPRDWRHAKIDDAIEHGKQVLEEQDLEEVLIVKVVRLLRRKPQPIEVKIVP